MFVRCTLTVYTLIYRSPQLIISFFKQNKKSAKFVILVNNDVSDIGSLINNVYVRAKINVLSKVDKEPGSSILDCERLEEYAIDAMFINYFTVAKAIYVVINVIKGLEDIKFTAS